jgi:peptidoglycan hydrolase CwlO-like protein
VAGLNKMTDLDKKEKLQLLESWIETLSDDLAQFEKEVNLRLNEKRNKENYYNKQLQRYVSRVSAAQKRVDGKKAQIAKVKSEIESLKNESGLQEI